MLPFNKDNTVSAITSLLYWGKQNDETYINEQGEKIPLSSDKVSEIYYNAGEEDINGSFVFLSKECI